MPKPFTAISIAGSLSGAASSLGAIVCRMYLGFTMPNWNHHKLPHKSPPNDNLQRNDLARWMVFECYICKTTITGQQTELPHHLTSAQTQHLYKEANSGTTCRAKKTRTYVCINLHGQLRWDNERFMNGSTVIF